MWYATGCERCLHECWVWVVRVCVLGCVVESVSAWVRKCAKSVQCGERGGYSMSVWVLFVLESE